jgi:hypothetical protein
MIPYFTTRFHIFTARFHIFTVSFVFILHDSFLCHTIHFFTTVVFWFGLVWFGLVWFGG